MIVATFQELHQLFRAQDAQDRERRRAMMLDRMAGVPEAQRECGKAIRCDPRDTGLCRWCGRPCASAVPRPAPPYDENQGDVLKNEAYLYFFGTDEVDLPYWYQGAGRELA